MIFHEGTVSCLSGDSLLHTDTNISFKTKSNISFKMMSPVVLVSKEAVLCDGSLYYHLFEIRI